MQVDRAVNCLNSFCGRWWLDKALVSKSLSVCSYGRGDFCVRTDDALYRRTLVNLSQLSRVNLVICSTCHLVPPTLSDAIVAH